MTITTEQVKNLRVKTGAGMMLCKEALQSSSGDQDSAILWLRQKGITLADGKIGRSTTEGAIGTYIHTGSRVGVMVEILCETDFVAKTPEFQELIRNIGMQIAACPNVQSINLDDIPQSFIDSETDLEISKADLANKSEAIRQKIVEGRVGKKLKEVTLMSQPYVKDSTITVETLVKNFSAQVGENIIVRRFVRFVLGEDL
jgi:elongation factor Ts